MFVNLSRVRVSFNGIGLMTDSNLNLAVYLAVYLAAVALTVIYIQ